MTARKSKIAQNGKRRATVARHAARRAELKEDDRSPGTAEQVRRTAVGELRRQPRDAGATRARDGDAVDGRLRGHPRKFGPSRIRMREQAHAGLLPGETKSSW
ncbi:30S ribosomal protein S14 [Streptomyces sp. JH34]|uniref:30S ribosomal protein S14 n=1 Tax=Streptomyces sp. JH34 TaxID=2793633 RepID=UPI0023F666A0|nr:30S ribosomal protein S14 [Streptomyces sp. JH34]MDF6022591.1 30S ribosomal protein S14 [Streptomyces sp. JH34]